MVTEALCPARFLTGAEVAVAVVTFQSEAVGWVAVERQLGVAIEPLVLAEVVVDWVVEQAEPWA